jgi:hypothetical protein
LLLFLNIFWGREDRVKELYVNNKKIFFPKENFKRGRVPHPGKQQRYSAHGRDLQPMSMTLGAALLLQWSGPRAVRGGLALGRKIPLPRKQGIKWY